MFTNWIMKISNLLTLCFLRMTQGKEYPRILFVFLLLYSLSNSNSTTFTMFTQAHFYNTSGYDLPPVVSSRDFTFPLQVLVVPPHSQLAQQAPEHFVKPMPLLIVGWMRTTRPAKELRWQFYHARRAQTIAAVVAATKNGVCGGVVVAVWVVRISPS